MAVAANANVKGHVVQVIGPVVDVEFPSGHLPNLLNALVVEKETGPIVVEVEQHLGNNWVRCVAMDSTDGLRRGTAAVDTGQAIAVPVGEGTLGRLFNVLGEPIDEAGPVAATKTYPIHRPAPTFAEQSTETEVF